MTYTINPYVRAGNLLPDHIIHGKVSLMNVVSTSSRGELLTVVLVRPREYSFMRVVINTIEHGDLYGDRDDVFIVLI